MDSRSRARISSSRMPRSWIRIYPSTRATYEDIIPESIVVGDKTFEYTLSAPTALYELIFGLVIPKHSVEGSDFAAEWNETMWVSGGPFIFDEWVKGEFIS